MSTTNFNKNDDGFKLPESLLAENAHRLKMISSMPRETHIPETKQHRLRFLWPALTGVAAALAALIYFNGDHPQANPVADMDQETIDWYFTSGYGEVSFEEVSALPIEGDVFIPNTSEINLDWSDLSTTDINYLMEES